MSLLKAGEGIWALDERERMSGKTCQHSVQLSQDSESHKWGYGMAMLVRLVGVSISGSVMEALQKAVDLQSKQSHDLHR